MHAVAMKSVQPAFSIEPDPQALTPRLRIVLSGHVDGNRVADGFIQLYAARPEAALHDRLFDLTAYQGGFELEHLKRIAAAYRQAAADPTHPCRSAYVTPDRNFHLWAASMGHLFQGRDHRACFSFEEAEDFLGMPLSERARSE